MDRKTLETLLEVAENERSFCSLMLQRYSEGTPSRYRYSGKLDAWMDMSNRLEFMIAQLGNPVESE